MSTNNQTLSLSLLSHTNVGKTTLARTLLQRDIGEVLDQAHVTWEAAAHTLIEGKNGNRMILWDTPGFGDSVRLLREMEAAPDPLNWVEEADLDRDGDRPRWSSYQAVKSVSEDSDVVLYLVNAAEYPEDAGYVASEMKILSWIGKPVLVLLNQTGPAREGGAAAVDCNEDLERWRKHLAQWPIVRKVLGLDAFTRCWVEEGLLFEEVKDVLEDEQKELADEFLHAWRMERQTTFRKSMELIAGELLRAATDQEPLVEGAWGNDKQQATKALEKRLEEGASVIFDRLISLHGLDGRASIDLRTAPGDFSTSAEKLAPKRLGFIGGAATGLMGGLWADIASGGLSFGSGMILGALFGGFGVAGGAKAINAVLVTEGANVRWSEEVLTRTAEHFLLRYLAVAHYGRGRGAWREREAPNFWKRSVAERVETRRVYFRGVWKDANQAAGEEASGRAGLVSMLSGSAREVLVKFYPSADRWLA
ncbi:MAG: hypothetical protein ACI8X5_004273 [Planctomycetota bacterium]|jgi:hypothetical protein